MRECGGQMQPWVNMQCWDEHSRSKDSNASWKWQELPRTLANLGHWQSLPLVQVWMLTVSKVSTTVSSCQMTSASDCSPVGILLILANPLASSIVYNKVTEFLGCWCISIIVQGPLNSCFFLYVCCFFIPHCPSPVNPQSWGSCQEGRLKSIVALWETYKMNSDILIRPLTCQTKRTTIFYCY